MSVECTRYQCLKSPCGLRASPVCAANSVPTAANATTRIDCQNSRVPFISPPRQHSQPVNTRPSSTTRLEPRLEDGNVLLDGSSADADAGDSLAPSAKRRTAAHRAVAAASEPH